MLFRSEDVISFVVELTNNDVILGYNLIYPMYFVISDNKLGLDHYLPVRVLDKNQIIIRPKDVFGIMEPTLDFANYYSDVVDKFEQLAANKIKTHDMDDEAINYLLDTIETRYSIKSNINWITRINLQSST